MLLDTDIGLCAHSENKAGLRHDLVDHLTSVASLACEFAGVFRAGSIAWWLGLLHDVGKATEAWQRVLAALGPGGGRVGIDHKAAGTRFAVKRLGLWRFAMAVHGHHGGLANPAELHAFLTSPDRDQHSESEAVERLAHRIPHLTNPVAPEWPAWARTDPLAGEMLLRMLFSALVDADYLDTAAHFAGQAAPRIGPVLGMAELVARFERGRADELDRAKRDGARQAGVSPPVNELRGRVYEACVRAAAQRPGFFCLSAPTGLAKTFAAGGFAVHHAARHGLRRVIVAVPFLSVTDQNAAVYRRLLDPDGTGRVVLEHHSAVDLDASPGPSDRRDANQEARRWQRLAAENWDAEFIVTTTVQLLESLHACQPGRMRKLHRLARSVIVLDEVHALPVHVLEPVLLALRQLVEHFGVTVVLCSATPPQFWHLPVLDGVTPVDILAEHQERFAALRRVRYEWWTTPKPRLVDVATRAATHERALVVVNTTEHAREVYRAWQRLRRTDRGLARASLFHLSTRMCSRHRLDTLDQIKTLLAGDDPVLVVSTQLIEAGVDLDFPVLYRAIAPIDAIAQAAGRCNRQGCLGHEGGLVVVFDPVEPGRPPSYAVPLHETRRRFGPHLAQPDDPSALDAYFQALYTTLGPHERGHAVVAARRDWDCPRVAELFRMIRDDSVPILVDYTPTGDTPGQGHSLRVRADRAVRALRHGQPGRPEALRALQPFLASLPRSVARRLPDHLAPPLVGDLRVWTGPYDPHLGIDLNPTELEEP